VSCVDGRGSESEELQRERRDSEENVSGEGSESAVCHVGLDLSSKRATSTPTSLDFLSRLKNEARAIVEHNKGIGV